MSQPLEPRPDPETNIQPGLPRVDVPAGLPAVPDTDIQIDLPRIGLPPGTPGSHDADNVLPSLVDISRKPNPIRDYQPVLAVFTPYIWVTPALVLVCVGVYVAMIAQGMALMQPQPDVLVAWGANFAERTLQGEPWRLAIALFVHVNFLQFAINMLSLAVCGWLFERFLGNIGFLLLFFFAGIAGGLASVAWNSNLITAGAAPAIYGICGAIVAVALRQRRTLEFGVFNQLRALGVMFIMLNFMLGLFYSNMDWAGFVGGLACGFIAGWALGQPLTGEVRQRRLVSNVAFASIGGLVLAAAVWLLQGAVSDFRLAVQQFADVEMRVLPVVNDAAKRNQAGQFTDAAFADLLEQKVLPDWKAARQRLEKLDKLNADEKDRAQLLLELARNRQEGWELLIEAIRTNNLQKAMEAQNKQMAADAVVGRLKGLQNR